MNWNFLEILSFVTDALDLFTRDSSSPELGTSIPASNKKTKYSIEKISFAFLSISAITFVIVFKNSLPEENLNQTIMVISLMGTVLACVLFFILYVFELYYFKNVFQWLFFSCSTILLLVSIIFFIYFRSGLFL
ncbi:branched-chain amino acid ABC transporter substrate-binding protein [Chryseobacterium nematophagum]|uniref:Branched-chain amino acid ABC transporter substrate-binding protein n=1 Tax=Chryseobacterium nematophagum TaxID=2305228 RepID=A0A3M7L8S9_9FLAO|nr:branched-chain amino acid ABC transporter substrate-binding protein [Chryseobacterium nematophagum]RMZ58619.1 branched-chain amino acid ABC transporter substrate-binding protein [Chryseobacterium nematophagum]